tara:strand:- start:543 stop:902 length:360 start_codon:yes stop_codon:yes gene_type:complete
MAINRLYTPTRPSPERIIEIKKEHQEALQKIYDKCDDRIVEAKLYCVKGTESFTKTDNILRKQTADERDAYEGIVVVGTELQRCMDKTFPNITGIYSYNLTVGLLKMYEDNNRKLIIIN